MKSVNLKVVVNKCEFERAGAGIRPFVEKINNLFANKYKCKLKQCLVNINYFVFIFCIESDNEAISSLSICKIIQRYSILPHGYSINFVVKDDKFIKNEYQYQYLIKDGNIFSNYKIPLFRSEDFVKQLSHENAKSLKN